MKYIITFNAFEDDRDMIQTLQYYENMGVIKDYKLQRDGNIVAILIDTTRELLYRFLDYLNQVTNVICICKLTGDISHIEIHDLQRNVKRKSEEIKKKSEPYIRKSGEYAKKSANFAWQHREEIAKGAEIGAMLLL